MQSILSLKFQRLLIFSMAATMMLSACTAAPTTPPAPTTAALVTAAVAPSGQEAAALNPTDSRQPSATAAPTQTVAPTEAVAPTATAPSAATATAPAAGTPVPSGAGAGISGWCLPEDALLKDTADPLNPPAYARIGAIVDGSLQIGNLPAFACVFVYTFDGPAEAGLKLQVYENRAQTPWLTADLAPVEGAPESVAVVLRHSYIVAPPLWKVHYQFAVVDSAGTELRRDGVQLNRWTPTLCWNGQPPNPLTLRCPLAQDLHPWDPSYGTPIPTFPPEED